MRVLIDFTQIPLSRTGAGVYADNLVTNLLPILHDTDTLILVAQNDDEDIRRVVKEYVNVELVTIPAGIFRNRTLLMAFEQTILPFIAWKRRADLIHSLHCMHPLVGFIPKVITVHDLTHFLLPELHTRSRRIIMPFFVRRAMKYANAVIFVSNATQLDAERLMGDGRNIHCAIPLGVVPDVSLLDDSSSSEVLSEMGVDRPYLLFIGTLEPRKNIVRIVQAFERIAHEHPELTLVLAGKLGWHTSEIVATMENSPMRSRIRHLGFVSEIQKRVLLRNCEMLVYPSLYEGFGLPVLEGMAAGAPVITSNVSSMPEVAGDAAILVDPTSVEAIATAMATIKENRGLAKHLQQAGRAQAQSFPWSKTADLTIALYRVVNAKSGDRRFGKKSI